MGRQNEYRNREFAIKIAQETGGQFIDIEYRDVFGAYWIVIWR
jgi:hypothetical protein